MSAGGRHSNDKAEPGTHSCPGCGIRLKHFERYPWYFCQGCLEQAEDCEGKRLVFFNISISGGLGWRYADDPSAADRDVIEVICFICTRPVLVTEARFGGVVAQPLAGDRPGPPVAGMSVDLTDIRNLAATRKRLGQMETSWTGA